jgi:hypothetical protein
MYVYVVVSSYNDLRWEIVAGFVDISWIIDHQCLSFLFHEYPVKFILK